MSSEENSSCLGKSFLMVLMLIVGIVISPLLLVVSLFLIYYYTKKKPDRKKKKYAIIVSVISTIFTFFLGYGIITYDKTPDSSSETSQENQAEEQSSAEEEFKYAEDEVVDQFITSYNSISSSPLVNIHQGNIRIKYFGESYGYWVEMLNSNETNKIIVKIDQTNETAPEGVAGMKKIFCDVIQAIKSELDEDEINAYFDKLVSNEDNVNDEFHALHITFIPDMDFEEHSTRGRLEIRDK